MEHNYITQPIPSDEISEPMADASSELPLEEANEDSALYHEIRCRAEAEGLTELYPDFDPAAALADLDLGPILRGQSQPTLRHLYEATHMDALVERRVNAAVAAKVSAAVAAAVEEAVATAVRESEERLLGHIRARGTRPAENGTVSAPGIRLHPAVERLTRRERAMLALRAERGETVEL